MRIRVALPVSDWSVSIMMEEIWDAVPRVGDIVAFGHYGHKVRAVYWQTVWWDPSDERDMVDVELEPWHQYEGEDIDHHSLLEELRRFIEWEFTVGDCNAEDVTADTLLEHFRGHLQNFGMTEEESLAWLDTPGASHRPV